MDVISILNLIVACSCAFAAGVYAADKNYKSTCLYLALSLLNLAVAFL